MKLTIHRGSKEIGGSCVEVEIQGQRLLLDLGLPLDAEGDPRQFLPKVSGLDGRDPSLLGILISHPHQDHFGLLAQIPADIPIGMGFAAHRILTAAAPFMKDSPPPPPLTWGFQNRKPVQIGPFTITPYLVDHSAYDSYALLVEADGKKVFYSGDFRAHGRKNCFEKLLQNPPKDIDVLFLEGTCIGRIKDGEVSPTEKEMEAEFVQAFTDTKGLALVQCSAQNIDRIVSIFRACKRTGRTLVIDLYAAAVLEATGNRNLPQSDWDGMALFLPESQRRKVKNNGWFDLLKYHSKDRVLIMNAPGKKPWRGGLIQENPEKYTLLFRSLHIDDLDAGNCLNGASYIYSQWDGYWERDSFKSVRNWLDRHGIPKTEIHTSGHASPADLQKFVTALNPQKVVPVHSFDPERYKELFENVEIHKDGESWTVE
jgi:ribonuclease J